MKITAKMSRFLSQILRHDPGKAGIQLTEAGWAPVSAILQTLGVDREDLDQIVFENNKQRFEYDESGQNIRARQGHTVKVNLGYDVKDPPDKLYHGTSYDRLKNIARIGLQKMSRHDVHMFDNKEFAKEIAIQRRTRPVVLTIDSREMSLNGYMFKLSNNNVWLIETVLPRYLYLNSERLTDIFN